MTIAARRGFDADIGSDEEGWEYGSTPRMAGASEGKEVKERAQQSNNGVKQALWEFCPTFDHRRGRGC
uniref:Uncharacterized protein n=1 Tax=Oryza glumipatula TaxID=40148 RepID=A0A0E0A441_9ORYZ